MTWADFIGVGSFLLIMALGALMVFLGGYVIGQRRTLGQLDIYHRIQEAEREAALQLRDEGRQRGSVRLRRVRLSRERPTSQRRS